MSVSERLYHSFFNLVDELQLKGRAVAVAWKRPGRGVCVECGWVGGWCVCVNIK